MDTKELETLDWLHYSPVDVNGGVFGPPFPVDLLTLMEKFLSRRVKDSVAEGGV